jgi:ParB-like chromosome segregation protein Spo0J
MTQKAPEIGFWHKSKIKRGSDVRKSRDQEELRRLGESFKRRWITPLLGVLTHDGFVELIDGDGRFVGGCLAGMEEFPIQLVDRAITKNEIRLIQLISVTQRTDLPDYDKAVAMRDVKQAHPELTNKQLADEVLHIDPSTVTRYLSLFSCVEAVIDAASKGLVTVSKWYALSRLLPEQQPPALALALNGASRDELENRGRKARNASLPAVRVSRVKCALPSGVSVTLAGVGTGLTLDDVISTLTELLKEAKRANDQGLDSKTFSAVMRDKSKAG